MSHDCLIFLSGGMGNLSRHEQTKWRNQIKNAILYGDYDYDIKPYFFDPTTHYNYEEKLHKSELEVYEYNMNALRKSDLVIVNFNDVKSIVTAMELAVAKELKIPVVGLLKDDVKINPWLECCCTRICNDIKEVVEYVVSFFLN